MFWKKKQVTAAPAPPGATAVAGVEPAEKTKAEKKPGPKPVTGLVEKYLTTECKLDVNLARLLKYVVRRRPQGMKSFDCRIFDQSEADAKEVKIKDYSSLDANPDLVLYEGWYDEDAKRVEMTEKRKVSLDAPVFTEKEILEKIEALKEPGSSVFFYQAAGPATGGPMGRGAAIIQLNPGYAAKKGKKYIIYTANVVGMEPSTKLNKLFDAEKPKEITKWIAQSHHKRTF